MPQLRGSCFSLAIVLFKWRSPGQLVVDCYAISAIVFLHEMWVAFSVRFLSPFFPICSIFCVSLYDSGLIHDDQVSYQLIALCVVDYVCLLSFKPGPHLCWKCRTTLFPQWERVESVMVEEKETFQEILKHFPSVDYCEKCMQISTRLICIYILFKIWNLSLLSLYVLILMRTNFTSVFKKSFSNNFFLSSKCHSDKKKSFKFLVNNKISWTYHSVIPPMGKKFSIYYTLKEEEEN